MNKQEEPLSKAGIEELASNRCLKVEIVADRAALREYLESAVRAGEMQPSQAVEVYCERLGSSGEDNLIEVAEEFAGFSVYDAASTEIDTTLGHDDLWEVFDFLEEQM